MTCTNVTFDNFHIIAPAESPNTDGIHIGWSKNITIQNSIIETGDDCVSIGDGCEDLHIEGVKCGPGHGISVGSLGRNTGEKPVKGVFVKNCTFSSTMNGVRIKTWPDSEPGEVTDMHFEDLCMDKVDNPIIIEQDYCPHVKCDTDKPSLVKVHNVFIKNVSGTSNSPEVVKLRCSKANNGCENVHISDINLTYDGPSGPAIQECRNTKPIYEGKNVPPGCEFKRDPLSSDDVVDLPIVEKLIENHTLIRRYPKVFLSVIGLSRTFVDTDIHPTFISCDKNDMGLLDFVKFADSFKTIRLVDHTIMDELKEVDGKKKRKVGFSSGLSSVKKARAGGIVILVPNPTTASKTPTALKVISHIPYVQTEDEAVAAGPRDAKIITLCSKLKKAKGEATDVVELRMWVSELETMAAAKAKELASLNVQNAELLGKVSKLELVLDELKSQVSKLEADCEGFCGDIAGEAKMRTKFMSVQDAEAQRIAQLNTELDACIAELKYDRDTKFYPHMLIAVARHKWMIGHDLCLAVMKCSQSTEYCAVLGNAISMAIKNLEALKDSPLELLMSSLTLKGDHGEENPTLEFRNMQPISDQVTVLVYYERGGSGDLGSISHEILLSNALVVSYARGEKNKKGCTADLGVVLFFHFCFAICFTDCSSFMFFLQHVKVRENEVCPLLGLIMMWCANINRNNQELYFSLSSGNRPEISVKRPWGGDCCELLLGVPGYQAVYLAIIEFFYDAPCRAVCKALEQWCYLVGEAGRRDLAECVCLLVYASWDLFNGELFEAVDEHFRFFQILDHTLLLYYVNSIPFGFVRMSPTPDPSKHEDPSVKRVHGSRISSSIGIPVGEASSSSLSAMKPAKIWPRMNVLGIARLTKLFDICCGSLSVNKTALIASLAAQSVLGNCNFMTASAFSGYALIPFMFTMWPRNIPSSDPKVVNIYFQIPAYLFFESFVHKPLIFKRCSAMDLGTPVISADRLPPIMSLYLGYSGWIATLIPFYAAGSLGMSPASGHVTILRLVGITVLLRNCSYKTSEAEPPSTYIRWMRCPPIYASITIGLSCLLSSASDENEISRDFSLQEFSKEPDIGGGALNFTVSIATISFGDDGPFSWTSLPQPLRLSGKQWLHSSSHLQIANVII
uniref:Polygalacturonase-like n=1 Tax=Tanacetum cinerariifolium TaxID=118510 RepID=A0A6L2MD14_TANCI|nr:polygalacturonase-like [Tanacetum cinerariifolium]